VQGSDRGIPQHRFAAWPKLPDGRRACSPRAHPTCRSVWRSGVRRSSFGRVVRCASESARSPTRVRSAPLAGPAAKSNHQAWRSGQAAPVLALVHAPDTYAAPPILSPGDRADYWPVILTGTRLLATDRALSVVTEPVTCTSHTGARTTMCGLWSAGRVRVSNRSPSSGRRALSKFPGRRL
jgi:hypothetical protein